MPPDFVLPTDFQNPAADAALDAAAARPGEHRSRQSRLLRRRAAAARRDGRAGARGAARHRAGDDARRALSRRRCSSTPSCCRWTDEVVGGVRRAILAAVRRGRVPAADRLRQRGEPAARARRSAAARDCRARRARRRRVARGPPAAHREPGADRRQRRRRASRSPSRGVRSLAWWNPASIPARRRASRSTCACSSSPLLVALVTSVLFSLAPALRALRVDLTDSLKDGSQSDSSGGARQRFRNALVVVEMALAVVLLVGAGLMLRSLWALQRDRPRLRSATC